MSLAIRPRSSKGAAWLVAGCLMAWPAPSPGQSHTGPTPTETSNSTAKPAADAAKPAPEAKSAKPVAKKAADAGPMVLSAEAARARRNAFAMPGAAGSSQADGPIDWREIPPWRQASFFGLRAEGRVFIFVVDRSGSMEDEDRLDRAKRELLKTVGAMQAPQRFQVVFYNDRASPMPGDLPKPAGFSSRTSLARWMDTIDAYGGTDPRDALNLAIGQRPDAVFLLSDGAFPEGTVDDVARLNRHKVPIHCVDLAGGAAGTDLKTIAQQSGGRYATSGPVTGRPTATPTGSP